MTLDLLSGCSYKVSYTSSTPCSIFVLGLPSLCSFAQAAVSTVRRALLAWILRFPFSSVCGVLPRPLWQHNSAILTIPEVKNMMVPYQLPLRLMLRNVAVRRKKYTCIFRFFTTQISLFNKYELFMVWRTNTYKRTYIQKPLAFNMLMWGSLRLAPIIEVATTTYDCSWVGYCQILC